MLYNKKNKNKNKNMKTPSSYSAEERIKKAATELVTFTYIYILYFFWAVPAMK